MTPARGRANEAMEQRRLGRTDIVASMLGFGGSEIGYQSVSARTVARLLGSALDAGLNVIDTAECYLKTDYVDLIQLHSCSLAELRKGEAIEALEQARERGWARYIGYSGDGEAARYAVECGRFDTLQTSVSIADQEAIERTLPLALARRMGVIAKRPLANVAWSYDRKPSEPYYQTYWSRLRRLDYPFLRSEPDTVVSTALRFTLSVPGVHTAIVGTTKPERWQANAALLQAGALAADEFDRIRARWREAARSEAATHSAVREPCRSAPADLESC